MEWDCAFARFIDVILPDGGYAMVQVETYFDESGSHDGAPVLCIAGYLMLKDKAIALTDEWRGVLAARELPYFRMSECAHGNGPFETLTLSDRIQIVARLIQIIKQYTICGLSVTMNSDEFSRTVPHHPLIGRPYTFLANVLLQGVRLVLNGLPGVTVGAYFFEAGHASHREADDLMTILFTHPKLKDGFRYSGHAFVDKKKTPAVQAADLLAWQWYTDKRHEMEGRPRRKDCAKLLEHSHRAVHVDSEKMAIITLTQQSQGRRICLRFEDAGHGNERTFEPGLSGRRQGPRVA
jgi:hypothetical protein